MKLKNWFFEKTNKTDKPSAQLIKKKRDQINKVRNEKEVTTEIKAIQRIISNHYSYMPIKWDNVEEIDNFLERYNLLRLKQEEV